MSLSESGSHATGTKQRSAMHSRTKQSEIERQRKSRDRNKTTASYAYQNKATGNSFRSSDLQQPINDQQGKPDVVINQSAVGKINQKSSESGSHATGTKQRLAIYTRTKQPKLIRDQLIFNNQSTTNNINRIYS